MDHDLEGLLDNPVVQLTKSQVKTYFKQLLEGTEYLHHVSYIFFFGEICSFINLYMYTERHTPSRY